MMLTPCWPSAGPTGGAGFACPPGIWSLMSVRTFLAMSVELLHLVECELHRHLALEDVDEHLELLGVRVHVDDLAVEVGERPGGYFHRLAQREHHLRARPLPAGRARVQDPVDLGLCERDGLRDLVVQPQVHADDRAGDQHDCGPLDHLRPAGPLDFLELGPGLADEPKRAASRRAALAALALRLDETRPDLSLTRARAIDCFRLRLLAIALLEAPRTALLTGLAGH